MQNVEHYRHLRGVNVKNLIYGSFNFRIKKIYMKLDEIVVFC